jgi:acyl-CoA reductase-like NAD-dependent aldehyde dehydrogenase
MVSFSGSTSTGKEVMRLASSTTKKICLELGGKSPNIVFADCDLDSAVGGTLSAIFMNQGQMCTAGSRLLLEDKIYDEFLSRLVAKTKSLKIGKSLSYETDIGPVISQENREKILKMIQAGKKEGAALLCGGGVPQDKDLQKGFYVEPTIFADVKNTMKIAQEETFGPVLVVIRFSGLKEAINIANDSLYGLAACVWTKDLKKANLAARRLRCGTVWINTYGGFYNEVPFGGYKQSGFGRELGKEGLLEYTQTKHICTDMTPDGRSLVASWF